MRTWNAFVTFSLLGMLAACGSADSNATGATSSDTGTAATTSAGGATAGGGSATPTSATSSGGSSSSTDGPVGTESSVGTTGTTSSTGQGMTTAGGTGQTATDSSGGGSSGAGGVSTSDSTTADATSTTGSTMTGDLSIDDPVPGFASVAGGTSGGGTDLGSAIIVNSMSALQGAAEGSSPAIILVEPGNYSGTLRPGANKTIVGIAPGVTINGNIQISGAEANNIIIRNLAVRGEPCNSYDECRAGADAVYMGNGAHHIWLDHLDIADGQDGNCDATQGADYMTVSWTHFHYTYAKEHRFSNLLAGSDDEPASVGKLRITYMNSHWGERVDSRQPRGRFGNVHMLNNYHATGGGQIHGVGFDMALISENSVYDENLSIWTDMGSPRGWRGSGNIGTGQNLNDSRGSVFEIPYDYTPLPASEVVDAVTSPDCGAGNTCTFSY